MLRNPFKKDTFLLGIEPGVDPHPRMHDFNTQWPGSGISVSAAVLPRAAHIERGFFILPATLSTSLGTIHRWLILLFVFQYACHKNLTLILYIYMKP